MATIRIFKKCHQKTVINTAIFNIIILLMFVSMWSCCYTCKAYANDELDGGTCGDDASWSLDYDYTLTINGTGHINSRPWANTYHNKIKRIIIEDGITGIRSSEIGGRVFEGLHNLETITWPESLTYIYSTAGEFYECDSLKAVYFNGSLEEWCNMDWYNLGNDYKDRSTNNPLYLSSYQNDNEVDLYIRGSKLTDITITQDLIIKKGAFSGCCSLKSVHFIGDNITINEDLFKRCLNLNTVSAEGDVVSIEAGAFSECKNLHTLPNLDSVISIGNGSFSGCASLNELSLPSISTIPDSAFSGSGIEYFNIPSGCTTIGSGAFWNCSEMTSITIPQNVEQIGNNCFKECVNLETVDLSDANLTKLPAGLFYGCVKLSDVYLPDSVKALMSPEYGVYGMFNGNGGVFSGCSSLESITLPSELIEIGDGAFFGCSNLNTIVIPEKVRNIGLYAFYQCTNLTSITIPSSVTSIDDDSFQGADAVIYICNSDSYAEEYLINKGFPYDLSTGHQYDQEVIIQNPTCIENGIKQQTCTTCKRVADVSIPATGHSFSDEFTTDTEPTCTAEGSKSKHCTKCNAIDESSVTVIPVLGHNWDSGKITTEPTCTDEGVKTFACSRCEETKTEVIPATGHSFSDEFTTDTEPTCTAEGSKSKHCTKCDAVTEVTAIPANGHTFGPWEEVTPSTCEGAGSHQHRCEVCGFTEAEATDPTGHDIEENYTIDVPATCTEDGSQSKHCKNCEVTFDSQVIPATGHNYGEWKTTLEPTCTEKGSKEQICSTCKDKVTQDIPALGHAWNEEPTVEKEATCTETGSQSIHCARCNETRDAETIPALGHDWSITPTVDKKATCTEDGKESTHCTRCDAVQEGSEKAIPATGHKFSSWTTTKKATEIAAGQQTRKCSVCGKTETKTVAQLKPTLPAVKITTPTAAKKSATVKWKKVSKANQKKIAKIQIQYSTDKNFKKGVKTVYAKKSATSKKITKLTSKKTYYIRIRAYKKSGSVVHVSKWSTVKKVKAK